MYADNEMRICAVFRSVLARILFKPQIKVDVTIIDLGTKLEWTRTTDSIDIKFPRSMLEMPEDLLEILARALLCKIYKNTMDEPTMEEYEPVRQWVEAHKE